jgi:hypothetical protein
MKETNKELIESFEETLERYKTELKKDPTSTFYQGLVKNTEDYIKELKDGTQII